MGGQTPGAWRTLHCFLRRGVFFALLGHLDTGHMALGQKPGTPWVLAGWEGMGNVNVFMQPHFGRGWLGVLFVSWIFFESNTLVFLAITTPRAAYVCICREGVSSVAQIGTWPDSREASVRGLERTTVIAQQRGEGAHGFLRRCAVGFPQHSTAQRGVGGVAVPLFQQLVGPGGGLVRPGYASRSQAGSASASRHPAPTDDLYLDPSALAPAPTVPVSIAQHPAVIPLALRGCHRLRHPPSAYGFVLCVQLSVKAEEPGRLVLWAVVSDHGCFLAWLLGAFSSLLSLYPPLPPAARFHVSWIDFSFSFVCLASNWFQEISGFRFWSLVTDANDGPCLPPRHRMAGQPVALLPLLPGDLGTFGVTPDPIAATPPSQLTRIGL